jgi:hypothetical protein
MITMRWGWGVVCLCRYRYADDSSPFINYWFGYGLSYSSFSYSNLTVELLPPPCRDNDNSSNQPRRQQQQEEEEEEEEEPDPYHLPFARVRASVANTGPVAAAEVAQVYVRVPRDAAAAAATGGAPIPQRALAAFTKTAPLSPAAAAAAAAPGPSAPGGSGPPLALEWTLPLSAFQTVTAGGERVVTAGSYTIVVAGHAPGDPRGVSNELSVVVTVPPQSSQSSR